MRKPQPRRRRPARKRITPAEARRRAARHVIRRLFQGAAVADGAKVRPGGYAVGTWKPDATWIVHKNSPNPTELKSAEIIAICKRTGKVLYEGTAGDEG